MFDDSLGHEMGITDQVCLKVGVKVLRNGFEVVQGLPVLLVFPPLTKLGILSQLCKVVSGN